MSAFSDAIVASRTDRRWNARPKFLRVSSRKSVASARISLSKVSTMSSGIAWFLEGAIVDLLVILWSALAQNSYDGGLNCSLDPRVREPQDHTRTAAVPGQQR